jgi:hypothetical protein
MDFESYLIDGIKAGKPKFTLRAVLEAEQHPTFYITQHGETLDLPTILDYVVIGNQLIPRFIMSPVGSRA